MSDRQREIEKFNQQPLGQCPMKKVPHRTRAEAEAEAARLNADPDGWGRNNTFQCPECGWWHNGRPHKGKTVH
jgi:hypothetical protein